MKLLIILSTSISYFITTISHPMMLIVLISLQSLILCFILMSMIQTTWFSFILFLVFMGGLMVLFIYISSLASNEKFFIVSWSQWKSNFVILLFTLIVTKYLMNISNIKMIDLSQKKMIFKIYSTNMISMTMLTMIYLLLVLIIIINMMMLKEGPLRAMNFN